MNPVRIMLTALTRELEVADAKIRTVLAEGLKEHGEKDEAYRRQPEYHRSRKAPPTARSTVDAYLLRLTGARDYYDAVKAEVDRVTALAEEEMRSADEAERRGG